MKQWVCRVARLDEAEAIEALQLRCVWQLGREFYTAREIEAYVREVGTMDLRLIADGTYYVVEDRGDLVGCGGWSLRVPHDAATADAPPQHAITPQIRAVFVDPDRARQGIGRAIMDHVEDEIRRAGHGAAALTAMLSGVAFYRSLSYRKTANSAVPLACGEILPSIEMVKQLVAFESHGGGQPPNMGNF